MITEQNKGGIVASVKGVRVFIPASQSGLPREADVSQLIKQKVRLHITEVNRARAGWLAPSKPCSRRSGPPPPPRCGPTSRWASATPVR